MAKTIVKDIIDLLEKNKKLNSNEIADTLGVKRGNCSSYLNTLTNDGRIIRINDKTPYIYKKALTQLELLKKLHEIMEKKMDFTEKPTESEQQIILKIEELIK